MIGFRINLPATCLALGLALAPDLGGSCAAIAAESKFAQAAVRGVVTAARETSGMAASRNNPGVIWLHNDSGDAARVVAVSTRGTFLANYQLAGVRAIDFEDMAIGRGPSPGVDYLYLGDIGDNNADRPYVTIYRTAEPAVYGQPAGQRHTLRWIDTIHLRYPDGPHDAETLLCDPRSGDLYVITKRDAGNRIYRAAAPGLGDQTIRLQFRGTMSWPIVPGPVMGAVAGDISPDGSEILLKNYSGLFLYPRPPGTDLADALTGKTQGTSVPYKMEAQGEAVTFDQDGRGYFTHSEDGRKGRGAEQPLYYYRRISGGPLKMKSLVGPSMPWKYLDDGSPLGVRWRAPRYDDSKWRERRGPFEAGGRAVSERPTTVYFRKTFRITDADEIKGLVIKMVHDGGAAVYLNGVEVVRTNLMDGADYDDIAARLSNDRCDTWLRFPIDSKLATRLLHSGTNTLAVELHQGPRSPARFTFDLQLQAAPSSTPSSGRSLATLAPAGAIFLVLLYRRRRRKK